MTHISGFERSQLLLLPEAIDDYVVADDPVRFIDAFVDGLDLAAAGFKRVTPKVTGRPGYAPGDLLKLYIYGYLNRVRSSRRLEAECHRNIEVIWLLRTLKPDFKTIADFRSDNRAAFRAVFRQFTLLCRELNLFGRELLAVGWHAHQGGQQQGPQLDEELAGEVHPGGGQAPGRIFAAARRERCRGSRDRRLAHQKPRGKDRGAAREARAIRGAADGTGAERRESDIADRSRQPRDGRSYQGRRRLQYPGRRRREAQDDRRPGSDQSGRRHGPVDANRRIGPRHPCG